MTVTAPTDPGPSAFAAYPITAGGEEQTSPINGSKLLAAAPGTMWGFRVALPPIADRLVAMKWVARLMRGMTETFHMEVDEPGVTTSAAAATIAAGAGASLSLTGLAAGYSIPEGKWVTVEAASGRRSAHLVAGDFVASGGGAGFASIWPSLREPSVAGTLRIGTPYVEGLIAKPPSAYDVDVAQIYGLEFELREQS